MKGKVLQKNAVAQDQVTSDSLIPGCTRPVLTSPLTELTRMSIKQALLSVSDKTGVLEFARALAGRGIKLLSTGGTAKLLRENGVPVTDVSDYTGFPEMLDGRVKTLHPKIHGALLGRRSLPAHVAVMKEHGIENIDLVCVNLYPFTQTIAKTDCTLEDAIENIDIGGPAMIRSAAKNWEHVTVVVDPADYARVLTEIEVNDGATTRATRFALATKVYSHTSAYDGAISNYLSSLALGLAGPAVHPARSDYPAKLSFQFSKVQEMRYGENPHQSAAFYREAHPAAGSLAAYTQLQGKELSYNNIADADAAWECSLVRLRFPRRPSWRFCRWTTDAGVDGAGARGVCGLCG